VAILLIQGKTVMSPKTQARMEQVVLMLVASAKAEMPVQMGL
jgi:hypothetical protein